MHSRIESEDNNKIKLIRKLRSKKFRDSIGKFTIEGINLVSEAIRHQISLDFLIISESTIKNNNDKEIIALLDSADCEIFTLEDRAFERLTEAEHGVQVIGIISKKVFDESLYSPLLTDDNILILDRLQDPGNMGTVLRTAYAAGYKRVYILKGSADIYSPKVLRASVGAIFNINILLIDDVKTLLELDEIKSRNVVVTVPSGGVPYYKTEISKKIALVIGNEGRGISNELINSSDTRVSIPMNEGIESLNAGIAAAILMYESVRNRD